MTVLMSASLGLLGIAVIGLGIIAIFEGLVLVEMVKQVAQIRQRVDLDDEPEPISLGSRASRRFSRSDLLPPRTGSSLVLLLSSECAACRAVAGAVGALADAGPDAPIVAVIEGSNEDDVERFLTDTGLEPQFVVLDPDHKIGRDTGVRLRPAAVVIRDGLMVEAAAVRTARQLRHLLERLTPAEHEGQLEEVVAS